METCSPTFEKTMSSGAATMSPHKAHNDEDDDLLGDLGTSLDEYRAPSESKPVTDGRKLKKKPTPHYLKSTNASRRQRKVFAPQKTFDPWEEKR